MASVFFHASFIIIICLCRHLAYQPPTRVALRKRRAAHTPLTTARQFSASFGHGFFHVSRTTTSFLYSGSPLSTTYPSCLSGLPTPLSTGCSTSTTSHFVSILTTIGTRLGPEVAMRPRLSLAGGAPLVNDLWRRISAFPHVGRSCFLAV